MGTIPSGRLVRRVRRGGPWVEMTSLGACPDPVLDSGDGMRRDAYKRPGATDAARTLVGEHVAAVRPRSISRMVRNRCVSARTAADSNVPGIHSKWPHRWFRWLGVDSTGSATWFRSGATADRRRRPSTGAVERRGGRRRGGGSRSGVPAAAMTRRAASHWSSAWTAAT